MKLVVTSDWHADRQTLGVPRFEEIAAAVAESVAYARRLRREYDVVYVFLGDLADPESGGWTSRAQALAIQTALDLAEAKVPSVWIAGNHDVHDDGTGATVLAPLAAMTKYVESLYVFERPGGVSFYPGAGGKVDLVCLPYAPLAATYDPAAEATRLVPSTGRRTVVASHLMVPGVMPGEETNEMPRGRDVVYPFAETSRAVLRIQGHYHRRQSFDPGDGGSPIFIPGSLAILTFGEEGNTPSFLVIDV